MENENPVTEVTENVEQTTEEKVEEQVELTEPEQQDSEQNGRYYTDEELDSLLSDRYARGRRKGEKEAKRKYSKVESILKQGLEVDTLDEAVDELAEFYKNKGIHINTSSSLDEDDIRVLGQHDAEDIISSGSDSVERELQRLADLGADNMTDVEKVVFKELHKSHQYNKAVKELASIGVDSSLLDSKEFKEYEKKLNPNLSPKEKYEMFSQTQSKPNIETMGSMSNTSSKDNSVKEFYTYDEARKFTREDLDKNPKLMEAIEKSMQKWK